MSQGSLRTRAGDLEEVATIGIPLAMVPFETVFTHEHTPSNFANSAEILATGYANWVDEQVGCGKDNGLYKLTAAVRDDPPETFLLTVGDQAVAVAHAGEYVFLLEKGEEYSIDTSPKGMNIEFSAQDDVGPGKSNLTSWWWGWPWSEWTTDGGDLQLIYPTFTSAGRVWWLPTLFGSPDVTHLGPDSGAITFTAVLSDYRYAEAVAYHWTCEDGNVEGRATSESLGDVRLKAEYLPTGDDTHEITRDLTVVEIGEVSLPGAPDDGLVISVGSSVLFSVDCQPVAAGALLSTIWEICRLKSDATYDDWTMAVSRASGNEATFVPSAGGIYRFRVRAGVGDGGVDERACRWLSDEIDGFGIREAQELRPFGVVDCEWQKALRNCAKSYLANRAYARAAELPPQYGFSHLPAPTWKCNMFVAHRLRECGLPISEPYTYRFSPLPPLANDWAGNVVIPRWQRTLSAEYVQPGWVVAHPNPNGSGHVGVVDFDGAGIAAGTVMVNRASPDFIGGGCVYRKYVVTEE